MAFNFVADRLVSGKAYPALTTWQAAPYSQQWRQFGQHWPFTIPCELIDHCRAHDFPCTLIDLSQKQSGLKFYCIAIQFFDFNIDYFSLLSPQVLNDINHNDLIILFYYDEGDNPLRIKQRLDSLCRQHRLSTHCYKFISANTAADSIDNFVYFAGDELLYWLRNKDQPACAIHNRARSREFTVLSRTHKWWRATVMADLLRNQVLDNSYWSYQTTIDIGDCHNDNPIEIDLIDIRNQVEEFIAGGSYACDSLTSDQHNDHSMLVPHHFEDSYCQIVLETHFDADGSGGTFLTEKTFKCLKHGQPFVIVGPPGSLATLRSLGYRTFDHAIDNRYDQETNNTRRWKMILQSIEKIKKQNMYEWFQSCQADLQHNQQLFLSFKHDRLNRLYDKLLHKLATS